MSRNPQEMGRGGPKKGVISVLCTLLLFCPANAKEYVYKAILLKNPAPIRIDGDLSDWEGLGAEVEVIGNICVSAGNSPLSPPSDESDLSGSFRCIVDPEDFYIAVEVKDDRLVFGEEKFGESYNDDAVEVYFDGDLAPKKYGEGIDYDANDAEIRLSKDKSGKVSLEGMGLFGDRLFMFPGLWESLGIKGAIKEQPWGYTAELKVPKIVFVAVPLWPGVEIGFQIMVNDDDDGGRRDSKISWTEDLKDESWYTTRYFGKLVIEKSAEVER